MIRIIDVPASILGNKMNPKINNYQISQFLNKNGWIVDRVMKEFHMSNYPEQEDIYSMAKAVMAAKFRETGIPDAGYYFLPIRNYLRTISGTLKSDWNKSPIVANIEDFKIYEEENEMAYEFPDLTCAETVERIDEKIIIEKLERKISPEASEYLLAILTTGTDPKIREHSYQSKKAYLYRRSRIKKQLKKQFRYSFSHCLKMEREIMKAMKTIDLEIGNQFKKSYPVKEWIEQELGLIRIEN